MGLLFILGSAALVVAACTGQNTPSSTAVPPGQSPDPTAAASPTPPPSQPQPTLPTAAATTFDTARLGSVERNLTFCVAPDGTPLKMDIAYPDQGQPPFPAVVYVHGGSWVSGDKSEGEQIPDRTNLVQGGNLFISIDYRLAPRYRFPAQIEDVKCAIRSLRAQAAEFGLDPNRIASMGSSAGGHLVSLVGTADSSAGWDAMGGYTDQSSRVQAVIDFFGPTVPEGILTADQIELLNEVFGAKSLDDPVLKKASPASYISPDDPPFLILHGTRDPTVPLEQSQEFARLLEAGGGKAQLVVVENAGHGIPTPGLQTWPSYSDVMQRVRVFLTQSIGK